MSDFLPRAVKIGVIEKHPNADNLSITNVEGSPVIIKTGDFQEGQLASYIPVDSIVPDLEAWAFLKGNRRIKARRLRGVFSMGLLAPLPPGSWSEGDDLLAALGIVKYVPEAEREALQEFWTGPKIKGWGPIFWAKKLYYYWKFGRVKQTGTPKFPFPEYTDIESLRKHGKILQEGEEVTLSEKIHGSNARYGFNRGKLWVGSHHQFKGRPKAAGCVDNFWRAAFNANLETKLSKAPGIAFYGEVYGKVQKGFFYDKPGDVRVRFFDAMNLKTLKYLDRDGFVDLCNKLDLEMVPELYRGPWSNSLKTLAEGQSTLAKHIREGFVVKPVKERYDRKLGRVILKMVGEGYLTSKDS
jgi:hypothetical protein